MSSSTDSTRQAGAASEEQEQAKVASPTQDPVADWLFMSAWRRTDAPAPAGSELATPKEAAWLLLTDRSGTGAALAALLEAQGERCVLVEHGPEFARLGAQRFQADPTDAEQMRTVLRTAFASGSPCCRAIHLWSLDATPPEAITPERLDADLDRGTLSALHLAQALLLQGSRELPRLWLVTRGAQRLGGESAVSISQAPLWGLGGVLALENPEIGCVRVDLPPVPTAGDARALLGELRAADGEDRVALRPEGRFGARLARLTAPPPPASVRLREDASYLITGGLSARGLSVAAWMVARGARHLALADRCGASEAAQTAIVKLVAQGARIETLRTDLSRRDEVAEMIAEIGRRLPALRGVVHAAGALEDAVALGSDAAHFRAVTALMMHGALSLHTLTAGLPLDFFVLYASAAGLLGSPGQGDCALASTFLDALAHDRRRQGLTALSLDWGAFSGVGPAAADVDRAARGMESLTPDEGLLALERLWSAPAPQVAVMKLDLRRGVELFPTAIGSPFWEDLRREAERWQSAGRLRAELESAEPGARAAQLERHLTTMLAQVLSLDVARIHRQTPFGNFGLNSAMALAMRNRLEVDLGERLPAALMFACPTMADLIAHLMRRMAFVEAPPTASAASAPSAMSSEHARLIEKVAAMSDAEADEELLEQLAARYARRGKE